MVKERTTGMPGKTFFALSMALEILCSGMPGLQVKMTA